MSKQENYKPPKQGRFFYGVKHMKIMKFGGSSLGTGRRILHVAELIKQFSQKEDVIIVASAMYKVTDKLISIFEKYKNGQFLESFEEMSLLYQIHDRALFDLHLPEDLHKRISRNLLDLFGRLSIYLTLHRDFQPIDYDYVISFGERLSSCLLAAGLNKAGVIAKPIDAADVIVADNVFGNAKANIKKSKYHANKSINPLLLRKIVPVVSGFYALSDKGNIVTLGRGGSDYSATILAHILSADEVILWKEVDGVFSSDPKKDDKARFYPELSYKQALKLAENGAKILHPEAMKPVAEKEIVVWVKNTFNPKFMGTKIWKGEN